jgi:hypothetical protein
MKQIRENNWATQEELRTRYTEVEHEYKLIKQQVLDLSKEIDQKMRERKLLNNDVVAAEAKERASKLQKQDLEN